jgi:hypothetical protein
VVVPVTDGVVDLYNLACSRTSPVTAPADPTFGRIPHGIRLAAISDP